MTLLEPNLDELVKLPNEGSLEARFSAGDEAALKEAYDAHGSLIYSICRRSVDETSAADITQEVFITAWNKRDRLDPARGTLKSWLAGITRNKIIDHYRAVGREDRRVEKVKTELQPVEPTQQQLDEIALRMLLVDALEELPERARNVISMAFFAELTHAEIADRTGIPLGTVKSDIRRGLERLRTGMGELYVA